MIINGILIVVVLGVSFIALLYMRANKKRDNYVIEVMKHQNKRDDAFEMEKDVLNQKLGIIKKEQDKLTDFIRKNECVLYGVKEQVINVYNGYANIDDLLFNVMQDAELLEPEEVQELHRIRIDASKRKANLERWFQASFRKSIMQYQKEQEGFIDGFGFTIN